MFPVGLSRYLGLNSGRSVSINVNKTKKHFSRNIDAARMFPQCFSVSHTGNGKHCFQCKFLFQDANYAYATRQGILAKIRACEHSRKNFASTSKRVLILFLWAIRAKAKFCEHLQIGWDHSIPLQWEFKSTTLPLFSPTVSQGCSKALFFVTGWKRK